MRESFCDKNCEDSTKILAIDVGTTDSGYVIMTMPDEDTLNIIQAGKVDNNTLLKIIKNADYNEAVYEQFQCYGMAVGESTIESITWNGRVIQSVIDRGKKIERIYRKEEKMTLCHSMKARDANIRQALIDRYAKKDKKRGRGTKKEPDTFYGVTRDVWQAVAVGVTYLEKKREEDDYTL